jgi:hypothetical protein
MTAIDSEMVIEKSDLEYRAHIEALTTAARIIELVPLTRLACLLEWFDTIAPLIDPTGYIRGRHNLEDAITLVRGAQEFMARVAEIKKRDEDREARKKEHAQ